MQAVLFRRFGGRDVLEWTGTAVPHPGRGAIRVRVRASSVNPFEGEIREGAFKLLTGRRFPMIAGHDMAGEVEALGEDATGFRVGDRVLAMRKAFTGGAHAELAVVPASSAALLPEGVSVETAGVVPLSALTAWQALYDLAHLRPGQRALIHGASGGVGTFALQLARLAGAEVVAVCSAASAETVRRLGASEVIDYRTEDVTQRTGFDAVFDVVSKLPFSASRTMLKRGGTWVCTRFGRAYLGARLMAPLRGRRVRLVTVKPNGEQLARIAARIQDGQIEVPIHRTYPVSEIAAAQAESATGHVRGKIAIRVP